jgi:hypothetical protein
MTACTERPQAAPRSDAAREGRKGMPMEVTA